MAFEWKVFILHSFIILIVGGSGGHTRALFQKELIMRGTVTLGME